MSDSDVDHLIQLCRSNDVDVKVDAVSKLQALFETGCEISDPDSLVAVLKTCLRHQNSLLSMATLSCLSFAIPLLASKQSARTAAANSPANSTSSVTSSSTIDHVMLRQLLNAFMPAGGLVERLGESRDKPRENARKSAVALGGYAFRASGTQLTKSRDGKGQETPLAIFERVLKDIGLTSKVWRVREQSMTVLVQIRRTHHLFPIRPYLSLLLDSLEDSDPSVRECAKTSVVELFTGPGVTDGARADLKKEMTKKNVRKQIAEAVIGQVAAHSSAPVTPAAVSESYEDDQFEASAPDNALPKRRPPLGAASTGAIPRIASGSGFMPRPQSRTASTSSILPATVAALPPTDTADVKVVYIASERDLETEFASFVGPFDGKESELNWQGRDRAITRVRGMLKGDVHIRFEQTFLVCVQGKFLSDSYKALLSLRTTLAANTCSLYSELGAAIGTALDPVVDPLFTNLLSMAGYTKKIMAQHSQATLDGLISCVSPLPRTILPLLSRMLSEKNMQIRTYVSTHLKHYLEVNGLKAKSSLEAGGQVDVLEQMLKKGLIDANPAVREVSRITFWSFHAVWPQRADALLATLDATNRKMVAKACPNPNTFGTKSSDAAASGPKKSSLAEQIAASRAKARQIATAPPSLIHQATSTSHIQASSKLSSPPIRAPSPSLSSKSSDGGPSSARPHGSPPKLGRIVSNGFKPTSSSAPRPRTPTQPSPPHSPRGLTTDVSKRTHSTKLVPTTPERDRTAAMRRAITTPLPASPPQPATVVTPPTPRVAVIPRQRAPQSSITALLTHPPQAHIRTSSVMPHMDDDQSLLLASSVPIPEDDYSGMDMDMDETQQSIDITASGMGNPLILSTSTRPGSNSNSLSNGSNTQAFSFSPKSDMSFLPAQSNSLSSRSRGSSGPVVEDALRARAEQAESAAERLLELVDPEEQGQFTTVNRNGNGHVANGGSPKSGKILLRKPVGGFAPAPSRQPVTPARTSVLRQAAQFQDTPNMKRGTSSMMDALKDHQNQSGWWLKRMKLLEPRSSIGSTPSTTSQEDVERYLAAIEQGSPELETLQQVAQSCMHGGTGASDDVNPLLNREAEHDVWREGRNGDRLIKAILAYLVPSKPEDHLEYGLIVLWELVDGHFSLLEGREADVFSCLLRVRYCNRANILAATSSLRDALVDRVEAVYGLTTVHGSLRAFLEESLPSDAAGDARDTTLAFALMALGKFILRLPAEIVEDELPRLKGTIISAFMDTKAPVVVRESAALAIIAAQNVLRDEAQLFALLDGLPDEKKNLLTYLFDKNDVRGSAKTADSGKLEREMRRIDSRTSTPMRPLA